MLAVGTALPMILGFFFVRPIPPPHLDAAARVEHGTHSESTEYGVVEGLVAVEVVEPKVAARAN